MDLHLLEHYLKQTVEKVAIRCSNCGKETMIYMDISNTNYQGIITTFVLNTVFHHVSMIWIIENHEYLKYDMNILNSDWLTGGPWYNSYICKKLNGKLFEGFLSVLAFIKIPQIIFHVISYKYMSYTMDHLSTNLNLVCSYHILNPHDFQLSISYQHCVTFYSIQKL